jgi:hypothetical protein
MIEKIRVGDQTEAKDRQLNIYTKNRITDPFRIQHFHKDLDQAPDPDPDVHNAPFSIEKIQILFGFARHKTFLNLISSEQNFFFKYHF